MGWHHEIQYGGIRVLAKFGRFCTILSRSIDPDSRKSTYPPLTRQINSILRQNADLNSQDKYFVWPRQPDKKSDKKILSGKNPDKNFLSGPDNSLPNSGPDAGDSNFSYIELKCK